MPPPARPRGVSCPTWGVRLRAAPIPAILLLDADRRIFAATDSAAADLGRSVPDLVGRPFDDVVAQVGRALGGRAPELIEHGEVIAGISLVLVRPRGPLTPPG